MSRWGPRGFGLLCVGLLCVGLLCVGLPLSGCAGPTRAPNLPPPEYESKPLPPWPPAVPEPSEALPTAESVGSQAAIPLTPSSDPPADRSPLCCDAGVR